MLNLLRMHVAYTACVGSSFLLKLMRLLQICRPDLSARWVCGNGEEVQPEYHRAGAVQV